MQTGELRCKNILNMVYGTALAKVGLTLDAISFTHKLIAFLLSNHLIANKDVLIYWNIHNRIATVTTAL